MKEFNLGNDCKLFQRDGEDYKLEVFCLHGVYFWFILPVDPSLGETWGQENSLEECLDVEKKMWAMLSSTDSTLE